MKYRVKYRVLGPDQIRRKYAINLEEGAVFPLTHELMTGQSPGTAGFDPVLVELHIRQGELVVMQADPRLVPRIGNQSESEFTIRPGHLVEIDTYTIEFLEVPVASQPEREETYFLDAVEVGQHLSRPDSTHETPGAKPRREAQAPAQSRSSNSAAPAPANPSGQAVPIPIRSPQEKTSRAPQPSPSATWTQGRNAATRAVTGSATRATSAAAALAQERAPRASGAQAPAASRRPNLRIETSPTPETNLPETNLPEANPEEQQFPQDEAPMQTEPEFAASQYPVESNPASEQMPHHLQRYAPEYFPDSGSDPQFVERAEQPPPSDDEFEARMETPREEQVSEDPRSDFDHAPAFSDEPVEEPIRLEKPTPHKTVGSATPKPSPARKAAPPAARDKTFSQILLPPKPSFASAGTRTMSRLTNQPGSRESAALQDSKDSKDPTAELDKLLKRKFEAKYPERRAKLPVSTDVTRKTLRLADSAASPAQAARKVGTSTAISTTASQIGHSAAPTEAVGQDSSVMDLESIAPVLPTLQFDDLGHELRTLTERSALQHILVSTGLALVGTLGFARLVSMYLPTPTGNSHLQGSPYLWALGATVTAALGCLFLRIANRAISALGTLTEYWRFTAWGLFWSMPWALFLRLPPAKLVGTYVILVLLWALVFARTFRPRLVPYLALVTLVSLVLSSAAYRLWPSTFHELRGAQTEDESESEPSAPEKAPPTSSRLEAAPPPVQASAPARPQAPAEDLNAPNQRLSTIASEQLPPPQSPPDAEAIHDFFKSVREGNLSGVRSSVEKNRVPATLELDGGQTALMLAVAFGHLKVAEYLLSLGVNVNAQDREGGTALMWAVARKHPESVRLLLRHGAAKEIRRRNGERAIDLARKAQQPELVEILSSGR